MQRVCCNYNAETARWRAEVDDADDDDGDDGGDELQLIVVIVVGNSTCMQVEFPTSEVETMATRLAYVEAENSMLQAEFDAAVSLADREGQRADAAEARLAAVSEAASAAAAATAEAAAADRERGPTVDAPPQ